MNGKFALALTAGMVVTVNPCGFAMLPAYLSSFLGISGPTKERTPGASAAGRALVVSAAVTAGFLSVFLILGSLVKLGADAVYSVSKWLTIGIGAALVALGIAMIFGYKPPIFTPKLDKGGQGRSIGSMFVFGVSYAVASLGCAIAPFLSIVFSGGKSDGIASGVALFVLYGLGFGLVLTALTVSLALATGGFVKVLRRAMQFVDRASAVLLLLAGLYVLWYGITEVRDGPDDVVSRGADVSSRLTSFVQDNRNIIIGIAVVLIVGTIGLMTASRRRTSST
jgi:cytochrome c-type biogenesis protein